MNSIELLKQMIKSCDDVIKDFETQGGEAGVKWLAKEVKKDCLEVIKAIQVEQGRIT